MQRKGAHALLETPAIYTLVQRAFDHPPTTRLFDRMVGDFRGRTVLDIGCGPGDTAPSFAGADYIGIDISEAYIEKARADFGAQGTFHAASVEDLPEMDLPPVDIAIMKGVLHHLTDTQIGTMQAALVRIMAPAAALVTIDPVFLDSQNPIARRIVAMDRGMCVRSEAGYRAVLARHGFRVDEAQTLHQSFPPYDRFLARSVRD